MAQRVSVQLVDDLDGGEATRTVQFGFMGTSYEIDLSEKNTEKFSAAITPFLDHARKVAASSGRGRSTGRASRNEVSGVREWARANGFKINERGRLPAEVRAAYEAAN